jgi:hypothetical protein
MGITIGSAKVSVLLGLLEFEQALVQAYSPPRCRVLVDTKREIVCVILQESESYLFVELDVNN